MLSTISRAFSAPGIAGGDGGVLRVHSGSAQGAIRVVTCDGGASRRVKAGREEEFEEWAAGILAAANGFRGYLGSEVLRPGDDPGDDEYRIVFRLD